MALMPWTARIYEVLTEAGDWVDREVLIDKALDLVPADVAVEFYAKTRQKPEGCSYEEQVTRGRRGVINRAVHNPKIEHRRTADGILDRMRPVTKATARDHVPKAEAWTLKAAELLLDGEWHPREELLQVMMPLIPPGRAHRRAEEARAYLSRLRNGFVKPRTVPRTDAQLIASGRRSIAAQSLQSAETFERERRDGSSWFRLRSVAKN